jgi:hypothetical protein
MRATRPHGGRDQYCIGKTASSSRPKNSKLSRPDSKLFPPSEHSPYQPNLLLIMANVEIAKTESPDHADLPAVGVATIGPYTAARDRASCHCRISGPTVPFSWARTGVGPTLPWVFIAPAISDVYLPSQHVRVRLCLEVRVSGGRNPHRRGDDRCRRLAPTLATNTWTSLRHDQCL